VTTTTQITAALRARTAGFHAEEAGTELLISHGGFLDRPGFTRFVDTFASVHDGIPMAQIDWQSLQIACREGRLALSGGEWRILKIAASLAAGAEVSLRDTLPGLDDRNLELVTTAIRHAAGRPPRP
jgi:hypothetical protein